MAAFKCSVISNAVVNGGYTNILRGINIILFIEKSSNHSSFILDALITSYVLLSIHFRPSHINNKCKYTFSCVQFKYVLPSYINTKSKAVNIIPLVHVISLDKCMYTC